MIEMNEAVELFKKAFEQARQKNRTDWHLMKGSVLNNRLLQITDRQFDPRRYGARDFRELVSKLYPWVQATWADSDYLVEWRGEEVSKPGYKAPEGTLLRSWWRARGSMGRHHRL